MPVIHIKSVPSDVPPERTRVLRDLSADVARRAEIDLEHFTLTWEILEAEGVVAGDGGRQPVIVDVLLPDLHPPERVEALLRAIADGLALHAGIAGERVFANARYARSGMVLDHGDIVRW